MPWSIFTASLIVVFLLQTTLVGRFETLASLDLFLVLALVFGLSVPAEDARLGAWLIGFAQDLGSDGALGVHAFSLGIVAIVLTNLRELVQLESWWTRGLVGTLAAVPGMLIYLLHLYLWEGHAAASFVGVVGAAAWMSLLAAVGASLVTGLPWLVRLRRRRRFRPLVA